MGRGTATFKSEQEAHWCWSAYTLATWCNESTHWKRPWCWERLREGGEGGDRGWDGWMASLTQWTWVWASSRRWWWTGKPGMLQSMGWERVGHNWATEQQHIYLFADTTVYLLGRLYGASSLLLLLFFRIFLHIVVCLLFHMDFRISLHSFREKWLLFYLESHCIYILWREYWYVNDGFSCVRINRAFPFVSGLFFFFFLVYRSVSQFSKIVLAHFLLSVLSLFVSILITLYILNDHLVF